jgi:sugar phosphate isomerase/epimerase
MGPFTRRTFLKDISALAAVGLAAPELVAARAGTDSTPEPRINFPTDPRERISVPSYPFWAYIAGPSNRLRDANQANQSQPRMTLLDFPEHVVTKFNVRNIEPHSRHFISDEPAYLNSFKERLAEAKVRVVNIAVSTEQSFYDADAAIRERAIARATNWIDVAVSIGSPGIRAHIATAKNSHPDADRAAESLRKVADYGAEKNIVVTLENDNLISEDAFFIVKIIQAVNNPYLRALPDFANSMMKGDADFNYRALTAMFQNAYNICHVKDGEADENGKVFAVDLKKSFEILQSSGFVGYCSIEYDAQGDPYAATNKLIEQTIKYLS